MNLKGLKAFLAVADSGSVTEAADRLALTQSGVSRQIASLEGELEFPLFDRLRGRLVLNRKGEVFLRHVRSTVEAVDHLPRAARAIASGAIDRVVIAATSGIVHGLLPPAVARYVSARPGLPPNIVMRSLQELNDLGPESRYDLVLAPMPLRPPHFELIDTIAFDLRLAAPRELLPHAGDVIALDQLGGLPFISLDPFASYQESVERHLDAAGVAVRFVCETSSTLTAARLVELGTGCAFLDPFVARSLVSGSVVTCRVDPAFGHSYGVFAPQSLPLSDEAGQALDFLRRAAAELS